MNYTDQWFPTAIYSSQSIIDSFDLKLLKAKSLEIYKDIRSNTTWLCSTYNTMGVCDLLKVVDFDTLHSKILTHVKVYADSLGAVSDNLYLTESWLNVATKGDYQEYHCHTDSVISGVFYIDVPIGSPPIIFKNIHSQFDMCTLRYRTLGPINYAHCNYQPEDNKLILFRSYLPHMVPTMSVDGLRISMSFNIKYK